MGKSAAAAGTTSVSRHSLAAVRSRRVAGAVNSTSRAGRATA